MRRIQTRLTIALVATVLVFSAFLTYRSYHLAAHSVQRQAEKQLALLLEFDIAVRGYLARHVRPLAIAQAEPGGFVPATMSTSYAVHQIFDEVRSRFPEFYIKFPAENSRNPENRPSPDESAMIRYFREHPAEKRWTGRVTIGGVEHLALFSPMRAEKSCLSCHGRPEDAPRELVRLYGRTGGFHRQVGDIVGLEAVAIPVAKVSEALRSELRSALALMAVALLAITAALLTATKLLVATPLQRMARHFAGGAAQDAGTPVREIEPRGPAEVRDLASTFNSLAVRLNRYQRELENTVAERTQELRRTNDQLVREVEARVAAQTSLQRSYDELEERVEERTSELALVNEELRVEVEDRLRAEEAARRSEALLRSTIDSTGDGLLVFSLDRRVVQTNARFFALWGLPPELAAETDERKLLAAALERVVDPAPLAAQVEERIVSAERFRDTIELKDGRVLERLSSPLLRDGRSTGRVLTFRDATEQVRSERERAELEERLQQAQKMEAVGTLASGVAHDFNNVLQTIVGSLDLLRLKGEVPPEVATYLADIEHASTRAADLVRHLLTFGRKAKPTLQLLDLREQLDHATALLERTLPKMIRIETRVGADLRPLRGDPHQLVQLLLNLAANARDAMPEGGRLLFELENRSLDEVSCRTRPELEPGEYVRLLVTDTGTGMDEETAAHVFEPFFTTKPVGEGTGLGLSTVYGIVRSHSGTIAVESAPGRGTIFEILLPAALSKESSNEALAPAGAQGGGRGRVLAVDDEEAVLNVAREALEAAGYAVTCARSGEEALDEYRRGRPDVVILDLSMPGMGGRRCLEELCRLDPTARVVIASGYTGAEADGMEGAVALLPKPYRLPELRRAVEEALAAR
ncbi:MAG: DUF3365 domain-containing protein [Deltaproteobacteria bacterium]|nr:DUF3365 domain-containing protein [Deltaproteobacteria bacterium]